MQLVDAEGNLKLVMNLKPESGIIEADNTVIIIRLISFKRICKRLDKLSFCGFLCSGFNKNLYARFQNLITFNCIQSF